MLIAQTVSDLAEKIKSNQLNENKKWKNKQKMKETNPLGDLRWDKKAKLITKLIISQDVFKGLKGFLGTATTDILKEWSF